MNDSLAALQLPGRRPWIMAHRGASDLAPENTLDAFALDVDAVLTNDPRRTRAQLVALRGHAG